MTEFTEFSMVVAEEDDIIEWKGQPLSSLLRIADKP